MGELILGKPPQNHICAFDDDTPLHPKPPLPNPNPGSSGSSHLVAPVLVSSGALPSTDWPRMCQSPCSSPVLNQPCQFPSEISSRSVLSPLSRPLAQSRATASCPGCRRHSPMEHLTLSRYHLVPFSVATE